MARTEMLEPYYKQKSILAIGSDGQWHSSPDKFLIHYPFRDRIGKIQEILVEISPDENSKEEKYLSVHTTIPEGIQITCIPPTLCRLALADIDYAKGHNIKELHEHIANPEWHRRVVDSLKAVKIPAKNLDKNIALSGGGEMNVHYEPYLRTIYTKTSAGMYKLPVGVVLEYNFSRGGVWRRITFTFPLEPNAKSVESFSTDVTDLNHIPKELVGIMRYDMDYIYGRGAVMFYRNIVEPSWKNFCHENNMDSETGEKIKSSYAAMPKHASVAHFDHNLFNDKPAPPAGAAAETKNASPDNINDAVRQFVSATAKSKGKSAKALNDNSR